MTQSQEQRNGVAAKRRRAVAYLRCSSKTNSDGDSFDRQASAVRSYCRRERVELVDTFRDVVTGKAELDDREGLSLLLQRLSSNGVDMVVVENATRLARDAVVHGLILRRLTEHGVRVVTAEGVDLSDDDSPTARFLSTVLGAMAELDKALTVNRLRAARDRIRARGEQCEGQKPFGHYPGEQETIERARYLRRRRRGRGVKQRTLAEVCAVLDAEGHTTRSGKPWAPSTLCRVLRR